MTRLILIRHGQSETNRTRAFTGQLDAGLSPLGREQAALTAAYCARRWPGIEAVYTSDLRRAADTGRPLAELLGVPLIPRPGLREILVPSWQGMTFAEIQARYPAESEKWFEDIGAFRGPDGESMAEAAARVERELRAVCEAHPGAAAAAVTHATPLRALQTLWAGGTLADMKNTPFTVNASVTAVRYENGRFIPEETGLCAHLAGKVTKMPGRE